MGNKKIYVTGGTVQAGGGLYIERKEDYIFFDYCKNGDFCYVLTARQMGKSSLMVNTSERLADEGIKSVIIDLTKIGVNVTAEQWYVGILSEIEEQLLIDTDIIEWWEDKPNISINQKIVNFFEDVLLNEIEDKIIIFIDEIDTTLNLKFSDDFFASIRYIYNARATNQKLKRLSFVLLGVASPSDLIQDPNRTPFNIGKRIDLTDFTPQETSFLTNGLNLPDKESQQIQKWIIGWTCGHPYLTQRIFNEIYIIRDKKEWSKNDIDDLVNSTFLGEKSELDSNLQFVRDKLTKDSNGLDRVLTTYREILNERNEIADEEQSIVKSHLKLSGVVKRTKNGLLTIRNPIYKKVFNEFWIKDHLPFNWKRMRKMIFTTLISILLALSFALLSLFAFNQQKSADQLRFLAEKSQKDAETQRDKAILLSQRLNAALTISEKNKEDLIQKQNEINKSLYDVAFIFNMLFLFAGNDNAWEKMNLKTIKAIRNNDVNKVIEIIEISSKYWGLKGYIGIKEPDVYPFEFNPNNFIKSLYGRKPIFSIAEMETTISSFFILNDLNFLGVYLSFLGEAESMPLIFKQRFENIDKIPLLRYGKFFESISLYEKKNINAAFKALEMSITNGMFSQNTEHFRNPLEYDDALRYFLYSYESADSKIERLATPKEMVNYIKHTDNLLSLVYDYLISGDREGIQFSKHYDLIKKDNDEKSNSYKIDEDFYYRFLKSESVFKLAKEFNKIEPKNAQSYYMLGCYYKYKREYDDAISYFQKAVELDTDNPKYNKLLADIYSDDDECYESAIEHYNKSIDLLIKDDTDISLYNLALCYWNRGQTFRSLNRYQESLESYIKAIEIFENLKNKNSYVNHYLLWRCYAGKGFTLGKLNDYQGALVVMRKSLIMHNDLSLNYPKIKEQYRWKQYCWIHYYIAWTHMANYKFKEAYAEINAGLETDILESDKLYLQSVLAHCYLLNNQYEEAIDIYLNNTDKNTDDMTWSELIIDAFKDLREELDSHPNIEKAKKLIMPYYNRDRGLHFIKKKDMKSALSYLQPALDYFATQNDTKSKKIIGEVYYKIGKGYSNSEQYDQSLRWLQESVKYNSQIADNQSLLCNTFGTLSKISSIKNNNNDVIKFGLKSLEYCREDKNIKLECLTINIMQKAYKALADTIEFEKLKQRKKELCQGRSQDFTK